MLLTGWAIVAASVIVPAGGCGAPPKSTRMTLDDVEAMTAEMSASLRRGLLSGRSASSEEMRIAITRVENRTRHLMDPGEQWAIMDRVAKSVPIMTLAEQANVRFVLERDFEREAKERGTLPAEFGRERRVTHVMRAVFDSPTREGLRDRTDAYLCRFSILELSSGEEVWSDSFDFKRVARGNFLD